MSKRSSSLSLKVIGIASSVGLVVAFLVGLMMYFTSVKPVEKNVQQELLAEMKIHIDAAMELKVQSGIMGATAMTLQNQVIESLQVEDRESVIPFFSGIRDGFRSKSNFNNIGTILMTADGRMMIRSWEIDSYGQNASHSPLVQRAMKERQAFGALGVGARGVGVMAISPVIDDGEFMGMISLIQGLASVKHDLKHNLNIDWVLLADKRYIAEKYGDMPNVDQNKPVNERYILANNRWFDEATVERVTKHFNPVDGEDTAIYLGSGKVFVDLPAYDEEGLVFGRHMFVMDESVYLAPINMAVNAAWLSLVGVLLGIFFLTFALVVAIGRMVIKPLQKVQQTTDNIMRTGNFSLRADVGSMDEVGKTASALNELLEQISKALDEANETVSSISQGDFSHRISGQYVGDLDKLKQGVNDSAENIAQVMNQLAQTMQAMHDGDFKINIDCQAKGEYLTMMNNAQSAMNEMNSVIAQINEVMGYMSQGQFGHRVELEARGEMNVLKERINESMEQLDDAIKDITRIVVAQSEGDLTQSIVGDYEGDLKMLKDAVNQSLEKLAEIVSQAMQAADIVSNASDEVSRGALDLSQRVQEQAAALEQTSATMDEMNSAVQNNTDNSQQAAEVASKVQKEAVQGEQVMQQTIIAMNSIQESSHKISDIVSLIDGIAFQTNLLALNAAVEAARAGDHGRGFAVVAGEVRALAQKSAEAAKDIKKLIDESVSRIDDGTRLASESGERLASITGSIEQVTGMINQIARASSEQAEGVSQVHTAISDIDGATQQNAALVEQTSAAAESMSEQATELSRNMAFFNTGANSNRMRPQPKIAAKPASQTQLSSAYTNNKSKMDPKSLDNKVSETKVKAVSNPQPKSNRNETEWEEF
ncbi:MAG: HAMP domain-containing protein [Thiomicrospira sp.]|uniref:methyl-accepting chemotaxis protein n=1 Tax=Thiomicrospira sp. TaxID=935 RepID=UPI0019EC8BC9|nr:methyl-accepting chemotaxis protein [Thiomicrospira sp.]MBE0492882.1 HAMP domain-containing protein [Thiomicrospira sp.]